MSKDEFLSDEYVAGLLAADAKQSSIKYSAMGLEAFAPSRPPGNKPKPNTRFLRNIIKDTDSHNAALLAKEAAESKARLHELSRSGERTDKNKSMSGGDIRRRQLGDIAAILGGGARKKRKEDAMGGKRTREGLSGEENDSYPREGHRSKHRSSKDEDNSKSSNGHRSHRDRRARSTSEEDRLRDRKRRERDRSRSRSPKREREGKERRHRERSPRRQRSRSPRDRRDSSRSRRRRSIERYDPRSKKDVKEVPSQALVDDDSDPLDDIIGPKPPPEVRSRGRGVISAASGMDSRFSKGYDPSADVQLDFDEENDWEQALEALRDRQKWKQQGADRLRAAGFTEDEVKKWEKGGEKREEDVKWAKKGEGREWDRGKVLNDEGVVTFDPSYGRLTDS